MSLPGILLWISCENNQVFFNRAKRFYLTLHRFFHIGLIDNMCKCLKLKCVMFPLIPAYLAVRVIRKLYVGRFFHKSVNTEALSTHSINLFNHPDHPRTRTLA